MKVLITGGFGYVGGRLGMHLATSNHEVYLGSRSPRLRPNWLSQGNIVQIDWSHEGSIKAACKNIDVVIHAAGMNAAECAKNPLAALNINGVFTERLVEAAKRQGVAKFIYLSTAHVDNRSLAGVITEDTALENMHPYAMSHVAGENAVISDSGAEMQSVIVRLANSFGYPSSTDVNCWMLVVSDLCKQATFERRLVIRGPSNSSRNFITMTDACFGIEHLINHNVAFKSPLICNLGDKTKTIFEIASEIKKIYVDDKGITLAIVELSKDSPATSNLDFRSFALNSLGFQPTSNFKKELHELVEFCECNFRSKHDK